jgi:hypothetical protein
VGREWQKISTLFMSHKLNDFFFSERWRKSFRCAENITSLQSVEYFFPPNGRHFSKEKVIDNLLFEVMNILAQQNAFAGK